MRLLYAQIFVEMIERFGQDRYEFILNEAQELSELGAIYVEELLKYGKA